MSTWGAVKTNQKNPLTHVVRELPPNVRQAMYGAARKGLIKRGTWDGCAFNAASGDANVKSIESAALHFDMKVSQVQNFITVWDSLYASDEKANRWLLEACEKSDLFENENTPKMQKVLSRVFTSRETKLMEELQAMVDGIEVDDELGLVPNFANVEQVKLANNMEKALCLVNS